MNSAVSKLFGAIMNLFHVAVIILCFGMFFSVSNNPNVMLVVLAVIVGYVMLVGIVCTLLAIRENLEALVAIQSPKHKPKPADVQRRDPVLNIKHQWT